MLSERPTDDLDVKREIMCNVLCFKSQKYFVKY